MPLDKPTFLAVSELKQKISSMGTEYKEKGGYFRKHKADIEHLQKKANALLEGNVTTEKLKLLQIYVMSEFLRIAQRNNINIADDKKVEAAAEKYYYFKILLNLGVTLQEVTPSSEPSSLKLQNDESEAEKACIKAVEAAFKWYRSFREESSWFFSGTHIQEITTLRDRSYQILRNEKETIAERISHLSNYVTFELERMLENKGYKKNSVPENEGYIRCLINLSAAIKEQQAILHPDASEDIKHIPRRQ